MASNFTGGKTFLEQPARGDQVGTWDLPVNANMTAIDNSLNQTFSATITSADVTLTTTQCQNMRIQATGALTGARNLIFQGRPGLYIVDNGCSGNFQLTARIGTAGGPGVVVPQGGRSLMITDGTTPFFGDDNRLMIVPNNGSPTGSVAGTQPNTSTLQPPSVVWDSSNNLFWVCTTTGTAASAQWTQNQVGGFNFGMNIPGNLAMTTSVAANALTVTVIGNSQNAAPTGTSPITSVFRSATAASGNVNVVRMTSTLAMTINQNSTMGVANGIPFRLWAVLFYNGGTPAIGFINCASGATIFPIDEAALTSSQPGTGGGNNAGNYYASASSISNSPIRIIGYLQWTNGLTTAGLWNVGPDIVQIFTPGIKKPGDLVARNFTSSAVTGTTGNTFPVSSYTTTPTATQGATAVSLAVTASSPANKMKVSATVSHSNSSGNQINLAYLYRGTQIIDISGQSIAPTAPSLVQNFLEAIDVALTTTYVAAVLPTAGVAFVNCANGNTANNFGGSVPLSTIRVDEIMG